MCRLLRAARATKDSFLFAREAGPHAQGDNLEDTDGLDGWIVDPQVGAVATGHQEYLGDHLTARAFGSTPQSVCVTMR